MRAAFQILAIPYRIIDGTPRYCVFHRADHDQWQFIAGGGEDEETPLEAAKRETFEEGGVQASKWFELTSLAYLPVTIISEKCRQHWDKDTYVIPEYSLSKKPHCIVAKWLLVVGEDRKAEKVATCGGRVS